MLFDLRGRGRRNTIKVIYAGLALLMGVGLVGFGIGGNLGGGGLFDAFGGGNGSASQAAGTYRDNRDEARARIRADRGDEAAWLELIRSYRSLSTTTEGYDSATGELDAEGRDYLRELIGAYDQYEATNPSNRDAQIDAGNLALRAYGSLELSNQRVVDVAENLAELQNTAGAYANLAIYAYQEKQTRKGDLARRRALSLASDAQRPQVRQQVDAARQQANQQAAQDTAGGTAPSATPSAAPTG